MPNQGRHYKPLEVWGGASGSTAVIANNGARGKTSVTTTSGSDLAAGAGAVHFVEIPCEDVDKVSVSWAWYDGTISVSAAVIEFTNEPAFEVSGGVGFGPSDETATVWGPDNTTAPTVTGPAGTAAGVENFTISAVGYRRCRLKFTVDGNGEVSFRYWGKSSS